MNSVWNDNQERKVNDIFKKISDGDLYALNWNHDCFEYNPNENIKANYHYHDIDRDVEFFFQLIVQMEIIISLYLKIRIMVC